MTPRILFKLTTRSRPIEARDAINNIIDNCHDDNHKIVVTLDIDDHTMLGFTFPHPKVILHWGTSNNKIHAVNRSVGLLAEWDILVATSDDMRFMVPGFDNIIREDFSFVAPVDWKTNTNCINLDQFLHYNDTFQKSNVCTLSIIGRDYYNRDGYIYHPSYESLHSDVEATEVAKIRGCYKYMGDDKIIFKHFHPAWGLGRHDEQYARQDNVVQCAKDKANYERRKANGFNN
jgi:hypothetical protein